MSLDSSALSDDRARRVELAFAGLALLLAVVIQVSAVWPGLRNEADSRRELLTAISLRSLVADGPMVDYPAPVLGQPWTIPAEFGFYHNLAALTSRLTGGPVEVAGRSVALVFFYLSLPALYLLARQLGARRGEALLAVALWLLSPFGRSDAGALTGTSTALALAAWWCWFFLRSLAHPAAIGRVATALLGSAATLAGPLLFVPFGLAGLVFWHREQRDSPRRPAVALSALAGLLPALVATALWIRHTDLLKAANPYAVFLQSEQLWATAAGTWAERFGWAFWLQFAGTVFTGLVAPLSVLLLLAFASGQPLHDQGTLRRLLLPVAATLLVLLPLYGSQAGELAPLILFTSLILARLSGNLFHFRSALPGVAAAAGALLLAAQASLEISPPPELRGSLPFAPELAKAVALATRPTDLIITAGQDWDPFFAYRVNRRAVLIPAGQETDLAALSRALGPRRDLPVGAVVITGRYRAEGAYLAELRQLFGLAEKPLLQTSASDVYVPAALVAELRERLVHSPLLRQDAPPPPPPAPAAAPAPALAPFSMMSPHPSHYAVPYDLTAHLIAGEPCFFAHAPTYLEFDLPAGGSQLELEFFMGEGTYTGPGNTNGAEVVVTLRQATGPGEELFRRFLDPIRIPPDRLRQAVHLSFHAAPGSSLRIDSLPGPEGRANFDWVYFRRIEIK